MKKTFLIPLVLAVGMTVLAASALAGDRVALTASHVQPAEVRAAQSLADGTLLKTLRGFYSAAELDAGVVVGPQYCLACHPAYSGWKETKHAKAYRRPLTQYAMKPGLGVVNDYDKNGVDDFAQGLDFNAISSVFDAYKPNAPKLSVENGTYFVRIADLKMPVLFTHGGNGPWKQRYVLRVPLAGGGFSKENYTSPIQFNETTKRYVLYNATNWYDATTKQPLFSASIVTAAQLAAKNKGGQGKSCLGCHTTGLKKMEKTADGEYIYHPFPATLYAADNPSYFDFDGDGTFDVMNITCESCHGPGSAHVLAGGDKTKIFNPADASTAKANEVCAQCHVRVKSVPGKVHDWPYKEDTETSWYPGTEAPLAEFSTDAAGLWPDGVTSVQHHQQSRDFGQSPKPGFAFHPVKCTECHEPHHDTANKAMVVESIVDGTLTIPTTIKNNTLCLACHATHGSFETIKKEQVAAYAENVDAIGKVVATHANHPYGADRHMALTRCVGCHMPTTAITAEAYDIHSHTFEAIPPEKTLTLQAKGGMPNSCDVSCHASKVNMFGLGLTPDISKWNQTFNVQSATRLQAYYGPGGTWWDTTPKPASRYSLSVQPLPAHWKPPVYNPNEDND